MTESTPQVDASKLEMTDKVQNLKQGRCHLLGNLFELKNIKMHMLTVAAHVCKIRPVAEHLKSVIFSAE